MRLVVQRVAWASVKVEGQMVGQIKQGLLLLLGIEKQDQAEDVEYLCKKIVKLRIFNDQSGKMNLDLGQIGGEILLISQFTLFAETQKGNRPAFTAAAPPDLALVYYENFIQTLHQLTGRRPQTGIFGAMMAVELLNDGPVTLIMDSKQRDF